jgi:hypothetical protein
MVSFVPAIGPYLSKRYTLDAKLFAVAALVAGGGRVGSIPELNPERLPVDVAGKEGNQLTAVDLTDLQVALTDTLLQNRSSIVLINIRS